MPRKRKEERKTSLNSERHPSFTVMIHHQERFHRYETDERQTLAGDNGNSRVYLDPVPTLSSITVTGNQWVDRPARSLSGCRCCDTLSPTTSSEAEHRGAGGGGGLHPSKALQSFTLGCLIMLQKSQVQPPPASNHQPPASEL